jgi:hypothetical protein
VLLIVPILLLNDFVIRGDLEKVGRGLVAAEIFHFPGGFADAWITGFLEGLNPEFAKEPDLADDGDVAVSGYGQAHGAELRLGSFPKWCGGSTFGGTGSRFALSFGRQGSLLLAVG